MGGMDGGGRQWQPGFLLRKKCHVMIRAEETEGKMSHYSVSCEVHPWMQKDENINHKKYMHEIKVKINKKITTSNVSSLKMLHVPNRFSKDFL